MWMKLSRRRNENDEEESGLDSNDMEHRSLLGDSSSSSSSPTTARTSKKHPKWGMKWILVRVVLLLILCVICHRLVIWTLRTPIFSVPAPIIHVTRTCPLPKYQTLLQQLQPDQDNPQEEQRQQTATKTKPKICLVTLTDVQNRSTAQKYFGFRNFKGVLDVSWKNKQDYVTKHGYQLFDESALVDPSRPPAWSKSLAVQRLFTQEDCDWVVWLDADTVIMNSTITVEQFLPLDPNQHFIIAQDLNRKDIYNTGAWIIRNNEWSLQLMKDWWNAKEYIRAVGMGTSGDQDALSAHLTKTGEFQSTSTNHGHAVVSPMCQFNALIKVIPPWTYDKAAENIEQASYYQSEHFYHKGDFLAHGAGVDNKVAILKKMLEMAQ